MPIVCRRDVWQRKNEREAGADVSLIDTLGLWVTYILGCPVPSYLLCNNKVHMPGFLMPFKSNKNQKGAENNIRCCSGCVRKDSPHPQSDRMRLDGGCYRGAWQWGASQSGVPAAGSHREVEESRWTRHRGQGDAGEVTVHGKPFSFFLIWRGGGGRK